MDCGKTILDTLGEKQICIDGKKIKGVNPRGRGNTGLYIVNAWVSENELCIGQKKVADKSNEITAIPEIINSLDVENAIVSIDAMGCQQRETRYYISSEEGLSADYFNELVRGHWGIENKLHWHLDVTFREDSCRARADRFSAENLSALRKLALQMIKNQKDKLSLKKRRLKAAYNTDYLKDIIQKFSCV
ncbi:ISAs1 family transposase [Capnocytophaga canimorsus]|uniref:ISAs1 family transposase n=1 Tax=Capnocytophaga canimorsus TaxID=28188 RepID=UPI003743E16B